MSLVIDFKSQQVVNESLYPLLARIDSVRKEIKKLKCGLSCKDAPDDKLLHKLAELTCLSNILEERFEDERFGENMYYV